MPQLAESAIDNSPDSSLHVLALDGANPVRIPWASLPSAAPGGAVNLTNSGVFFLEDFYTGEPADYTQVFIDAIAAMPAQGGRLYLASKTYPVNIGDINVNKPVQFTA